MGIFDALTTAVSGLRAQSYALDNIAGNIANSRTVGYKRTDTGFLDMVQENTVRKQDSGSVFAYSRATNTVSGSIEDSSIKTNMAISGEGFFVVAARGGQVDGVKQFTGEALYTRRGDFDFDNEGYLVNGAGYFLKGVPIDPATGNPSGSTPEVIKLSSTVLPAVATTTFDYQVNLPSYPKTVNADPAVPGSELLTAAAVGGDINTISANNADAFLSNSIAGGAVTGYDANGQAVPVQLRWGKIDSTTLGAGHTDQWQLYYQTDPAATGTATQWQSVGTTFSFDTTGNLTSPAGGTFTIPNLTVSNINLGNVTVNTGTKGLTQFADTTGTANVAALKQNGSPAGTLSDVSVSTDGRVTGTYTNNRTVDLFQIATATFKGPNFLEKLDGGAFRETADSGTPTVSNTAQIVSSALEISNTDIADEFTKLIVTQQAYSANTRIVTTGNEMMQEVLRMVS